MTDDPDDRHAPDEPNRSVASPLLSPSTLRALDQARKQSLFALEVYTRATRQILSKATQTARIVTLAHSQVDHDLVRLARLAAQAGQRIRDAMPPNWDNTLPDHGAMARCTDWGVPVTWVPSHQILGHLLRASTVDDVHLVLDDRSNDITEDCRQLADTLPNNPPNDALRSACSARAAGHNQAAQALSTSLITHVLVDLLPPHLSSARKEIATLTDPKEYALVDYRAVLTVRAAGKALTNFIPGADGVPAYYNRHAAAHTISPEQYTDRNSLVGLMLAASLTAELNRELCE